MSKIDVSIWGIRAGFEDGGIFHSHNFAEVKELQKDKFRGLADLSRPKNSYMINRTVAHTVVTIIHTDIFEFSVSGTPRSGYIAISLIFDKNKALATSPKSFLQQFVQWYKQVQGNTRVNNFTAEQIQGIVNQLTLVDSTLRDVPGKKAIAYSNETELDEHLTGGSKYVPFEETIFYNPTINFGQSGLKNEVIPMTTVIGTIEKEEEKKRLEEEQNRIKQQQIAEKERDLLELKKLGQIDQMIEVFDKFQYNYLLNSSIRNEVETVKQRRAEAIQSQEEQRKAEEISRLIEEKNYDLAFAKFELLREKNRLSAQEQRMMQVYKDDLRKKNILEQKEREKAENTARKKKAFKIYSVVGVFALLVSLSVFSFLLEIPLSFYDTDGDKIANSKDKCPELPGTINGCPDSDKDGIIDSDDVCPDDFGKQNGCPDTDEDGLTDKEEVHKGTNPKEKDTDGDRVNDKEDNCPNEKGTKENKGCAEKKPVEKIPKPVVADVDEDTKVTITYKNIKYSIKRGFTTENGMPYGKKSPLPNWRFKSNKWEKEPTPGSGNWESATQNDIDYVLKKCATKISGNSNEKTNPTASTSGSGKNVENELEITSNINLGKDYKDFNLAKSHYFAIREKITLTESQWIIWRNFYKEYNRKNNKNERIYKSIPKMEDYNTELSQKEIKD